MHDPRCQGCGSSDFSEGRCLWCRRLSYVTPEKEEYTDSFDNMSDAGIINTFHWTKSRGYSKGGFIPVS